MPVEEEMLVVRSDARVSARRLVPRRVRYQLARFCEWGKETPDEYQYQITSTLARPCPAAGINREPAADVLLNRYSKAVPPSLVKALERWDKNGSEARLERLVDPAGYIG